MSDNHILEMSKLIGQIGDELRDIKSAKEQAEAVIGSNKILSDSLQALIDSASNLAKVSENSVLQIIADITDKLKVLNIQASDIDGYAQQGMSKISKQAALAQSKLEDELSNLVQQLMRTISISTNQSLEAVGNELAGYRVLVHESAQKFTETASDTIAKIEDEFRGIKSAKEQAEAVIGSNKVLSDSLQVLFDSASSLAKVSESNALQIIADINSKLEMLNIQASDIDRYAQQGVSKISEQSALSQLKLEDELSNLVQQLMRTISISTNQSLEAVGNELAGYRVLVHESAQKFTDSTSDTIAKQEGQIAEIGKVLACIQDRQHTLDLKIEELRQMNIMRLFDEMREIRKIESENATATKKWRVVEFSAFGVCIVLGIAVLIRLLVT